MKRLLLIAVLLLSGLAASAQIHVGPAAGMSMVGDNPRFHAGVTMLAKLPFGFAVQPSLLYNMKSIDGKPSGDGFVELPVGLQWGPDLILFRPYVEVAPLFGINVHKASGQTGLVEYGVGVGGGLDLWKLQISARYNWDVNCRYVTLTLAYLF